MAVFTPITSPCRLNRGPPELPHNRGISLNEIIKRPSIYVSSFADTIPKVTVVAKPNGLPIAKAQFPTFALSEFPHSTGLRSYPSPPLKLLNPFFYQHQVILLAVKYHHVKLRL